MTARSASSRSGRTRTRGRTTYRASTTISAWRLRPDAYHAMTTFDLLLQQTINGLSLGAMYALLALGFTLVYGILELINFSHFNVFMVGSFVALYVLEAFGLSGQEVILTGLPLAGVLLVTFAVTMVFCGGLGVTIERLCLRPLRNVKGPAAMITTIGVAALTLLVPVGLASSSRSPGTEGRRPVLPRPAPTARRTLPSIRRLLVGAVLAVVVGAPVSGMRAAAAAAAVEPGHRGVARPPGHRRRPVGRHHPRGRRPGGLGRAPADRRRPGDRQQPHRRRPRVGPGLQRPPPRRAAGRGARVMAGKGWPGGSRISAAAWAPSASRRRPPAGRGGRSRPGRARRRRAIARQAPRSRYPSGRGIAVERRRSARSDIGRKVLRRRHGDATAVGVADAEQRVELVVGRTGRCCSSTSFRLVLLHGALSALPRPLLAALPAHGVGFARGPAAAVPPPAHRGGPRPGRLVRRARRAVEAAPAAARGRPAAADARRAGARLCRRSVACSSSRRCHHRVDPAALFLGQDDANNPVPSVVYVWLWVGLAFMSMVFGGIWRLVNPVRWLHRGILLALRIEEDFALSEYRLGYWPAAAGLLAFTWLELSPRTTPTCSPCGSRSSATSSSAWSSALLFGPAYLRTGDPFTAWSSLYGTLSPLGRRADGRWVLRTPLHGPLQLAAAPGPARRHLGDARHDRLRRLLGRDALVLLRPVVRAPARCGTPARSVTFSLVVAASLYAAASLSAHLAGSPCAGWPPPSPPRSSRSQRATSSRTTGRCGCGRAPTDWRRCPIPGDRRRLARDGDMSPSPSLIAPGFVAGIQVVAIITGHVLGVVAAHERAVSLFPAGRPCWARCRCSC